MKPRSRRDELLKKLLMFLLILKLKLELKPLLLGQRSLLLKEVRLLAMVLMNKLSLHLQIILQIIDSRICIIDLLLKLYAILGAYILEQSSIWIAWKLFDLIHLD